MNAAAPEGTPPRLIGDYNQKKRPARRASESPEAEVHRIEYDFHGSGMNSIGSCPFLKRAQKQNFDILLE